MTKLLCSHGEAGKAERDRVDAALDWVRRVGSRRVSKAEWYEAGGFANSLCWRREVSGRWIYYIRGD